jgi:hypothetical protein
LLAAGLPAQDFGLSFRAQPVFGGGGTEFTGTLVPWFAAPLGGRGDLYLSGGLSSWYGGEGWERIPELYRFELAWRFGPSLRLSAGRVPYREPLNLLMNGLYDGFSLEYRLGKGRLSAGAFYTGLLYKKAAYITMSPGDLDGYYDGGVYFAPRRAVFSLGWELPSRRGGVLNLGAAGQADLNGGEERVHSQYLLAGYTLPLPGRANAGAGALLGIIEDGGWGVCFAGTGELAWLPPGPVNSRVSLGASFSSGSWGRHSRAFLPVNTIAQGKVLRPGLTGLALVEGKQRFSLHRSLLAEFQAAYLFRTDLISYTDPDLDGDSRSPLLGGEVYGGFTWAPSLDFSLGLGGGIFVPQWGRAFSPGAGLRWRVSLEAVFAF